MEDKNIGISDIDLNLLREIPYKYQKNNRILIYKREEDKILALISDDNGLFALRDFSKRLGLSFDYVRRNEAEILALLNEAYSLVSSAQTVMGEIEQEGLVGLTQYGELPKDLLELKDDAPIIKLLNALFLEAVKERASDIHIEPYEKDLEVRFRVDGILRKVLQPPKIIHESLISRIKVIANLDIAEKRLPQDGRIRLIVGGKDIDIRVSIIPTFFGERAVLRILDRMKGVMSLNELGLERDKLSDFEKLISRSNGIVLVTGPTGSGKTTTLYASLLKIYSEEKNIITIEDPVEYQIKGIAQIQVNPKINLTFAAGLRSILRQDPDIVMIGEIRDKETAEIAVQASLTGHLVLSTLHTNDSSSAVTRLIDMDIEPFLVASSLTGVLAQRLLRRLCSYCKKEVPLKDEFKRVMPELSNLDFVYKGEGCKECNGKGYLGRTGIYELLVIDEDIKEQIMLKSDARTIKSLAIKKGMTTLFSDGIQKIRDGITTIEEVLRVTNVGDM
ncbi:MAG: type II secretion system ATPase GspE [Proteobacteria bacterium]|nr:type II secretion system ATPase GspE [Pseudomonadota bacterium]